MFRWITYLFFINAASAQPLYMETEDLKLWTITVRVYTYQSQDSFPQLDSVANIIGRETAKGFLNSTSIYRDGFHYGATFCSLVDYRVDQAEEQKKRIIAELKAIHTEPTDVVDFEVISPSDCFESRLD